MVDKALSRESGEQPLHHPLLKMELNDFIRNHTGIFEYHGPNRRVVAPFPEFFVALARHTERIHRFSPRRVRTLVKRRKRASRLAIARDNMQRFGAQDL